MIWHYIWGCGERNSSISSIFQALHLLGLLLALARLCRWPPAPASLINDCSPAWRAGLQSYYRIINLWAAVGPVCRSGEAPVGNGCARTPPCQCQGPSESHVHPPPILHLPFRREVHRLQVSSQNPGVDYGLNFNCFSPRSDLKTSHGLYGWGGVCTWGLESATS